MKAIKKILAVLLAGAMVFSFAACSSGDDGSGSTVQVTGINPYQVTQASYGCWIEITPEKPSAGQTVTVKATLGKITSITAKKNKLNLQAGKIEYFDEIGLTTVKEGEEYTFVMPEGYGVYVEAKGTTTYKNDDDGGNSGSGTTTVSDSTTTTTSKTKSSKNYPFSGTTWVEQGGSTTYTFSESTYKVEGGVSTVWGIAYSVEKEGDAYITKTGTRHESFKVDSADATTATLTYEVGTYRNGEYTTSRVETSTYIRK